MSKKYRTFTDIHAAHLNIFDLLKGFHREGRLHLIFGKREPFLPGIEVHEGLVFRHAETGSEFLSCTACASRFPYPMVFRLF